MATNTIITYTDGTTSTIVNEDGILTYQETKGEGNQWNTNSTIKSVTIGTDTESIDAAAFYWCSSLTSIEIPNSVTSIGNAVFINCYSLLSITIPNSISIIWDGTFSNCSSLTSIEIPNSVTSIGSSTFKGCSSLTSIEIPNSVTSIGSSTFKGCSSLTSIEIPNSVTNISFGTFQYCTSLSSVTIPNDVTSIGENVFWYCSSLTSIEIPNSVISIGGMTFYECSSLTSVYFDKPMSEISSMTGKYWSLKTRTKIYASDGIITVTGSNTETFEKYVPHTIITYTDGTTSSIVNDDGILTGEEIKGEGNEYNSNTTIKSVIIGTDTLSIGGRAFYKCTSLSSITIPTSVTSIGYQAFCNCTSLSSVTIPETVKSIGDRVFLNCYSLLSVTIPNSVTNIDEYAFANCRSLSSITIPNSITSIGNSAFTGCSSLTSVTIPNSVINIDIQAFNKCSSLTSIEIPNSVTSIGNGVFLNCYSLLFVTYNKPMSEISSMSNKYWNLQTGAKIYASDGIITVAGYNTGTFEDLHTIITYTDGTTSSIVNDDGILTGEEIKGEGNEYNSNTTIKSVIIGTDTESIGDITFQYCTSLSSITIPSSITSIGIGAFGYCSSLTSVTIPNSVTSIDDWAFRFCYSLSSITMSETIKNIGNNTFTDCYSLLSINIPNSVSSIGDGTFYNCYSLLSVTFDKPMSEISSMSNRYWKLKPGAKIYASDGIITVTGSDTEIVEEHLDLSSYGHVLNTRLILKNDTAANFLSSEYIPLRGEPIAIRTSTVGWDIVIGNGIVSGSSLSAAGLTYKLSSAISSKINTVSSVLASRINTVSSGISSQVSNIIQPITNVGFNTWEGDAGFYTEKFYSTSATLNLGGTGRIHGMSSLTFDAVSQDQYGKVIRIPWEVASNNNKTNMLLGKTWVSDRGLGQLPYCQPLMPTDSDLSNSPIVIPNLEGSYIYWSGVLLNSYEENGVTSALAIQMPWDDVSAYGSEIYAPTPTGDKKLKATKLASQHWVSGAIQQTVLPPITNLSNALTTHIVSCTQADVNLSNTLTGLISSTSAETLTEANTHANNISSSLFGKIDNLSNSLSNTVSVNYVTKNDINNITLTLNDLTALVEQLSKKKVYIVDYSYDPPYTIITYTDNTVSSIVNDDGILNGSEIPNSSEIKSVTIGTDTSSIHPGAFGNCTSLTSIEIPETVETIGGYSFQYCSSLTSIEIPNSVTSIGNGVFLNCYSLLFVTYNKPMSEISSMSNKYWNLQTGAKIYASDGIITVAGWGSETFETHTIITYTDDSTSSIVNSDRILTWEEVKGGGDYWNSNTTIKSVTIGSDTNSIGASAFYGCYSLTSIEIPETVETIGRYAFWECRSLSSITFDKPMSEISSMTEKYWFLETGTNIYASDGIITVKGSDTAIFEEK